MLSNIKNETKRKIYFICIFLIKSKFDIFDMTKFECIKPKLA